MCVTYLLFFQVTNHLTPAYNHVAADRDLPPLSLFHYHPMSNPQTFTHNEFFDSVIGRAIREWNSPNGITSEAWFIVSTATVHDPSCGRMFSFDGFRAHAPGGKCTQPLIQPQSGTWTVSMAIGMSHNPFSRAGFTYISTSSPCSSSSG